MYREGPWEWQKPYSFTVTHAPILIGLYNGNVQARGLVTGLIDGWMAHGKKGSDGHWSYPNEINWRTDAERVGDRGGLTTPLQAAWASWRWTGDAKYLRPLETRVDESAATLAEINENAIDLLGRRQDWGGAGEPARLARAIGYPAAEDRTGARIHHVLVARAHHVPRAKGF